MGIIREKMPLLGVLTALSVVLGLIVHIPIPASNGYFNLLEVGIYTAALLLGGPAGLFVGAASGLLLDLILGYPQWMIFSLIIHGAQGYIAGRIKHQNSLWNKIIGLSIASIVMVIGYFFANWILYTWTAALASLPGNIAQTVCGMITTLVLVNSLDKTKLTEKFKLNK
ncbi:ECF transporter S component [Vagococcus silagei]|uniref:ECF transporter S component n=1 Tax=Vagococcus silagei TaxID=2508885 RepID=A0A4S3B3V9_9ENTE|nr:ECF transporter S component [Vagococcus silagei]THB61814.1 ECF transporter S component [Vagococcus silagei]